MNRGWRSTLSAYTMLAPSLLLFTVFFGIPMLLALVIAFKHVEMAQGVMGSPWVGFQNFRDLFGNVLMAERIQLAFKNTLLFTICFVPVNLVMSLVVASLIHSVGEKRQAFYRAAFYLPTVTSAIVFALIWKTLYDPNFGLLNAVLDQFGLGPINWTGDPDWAIWSVIIAAIGAGPGGNILIFLAALGSVPGDQKESARVEGANGLQSWWFVTLPHLRPIILYLLVLNTIGSFQVFELVFILTSGGPAGSSTVVVYEIYDLAFKQGRYGPAGALSLILLVVVTTIAVLQFKFFGKDTEESRPQTWMDALASGFSDRVGLFLGWLGQAGHKAKRLVARSIQSAIMLLIACILVAGSLVWAFASWIFTKLAGILRGSKPRSASTLGSMIPAACRNTFNAMRYTSWPRLRKSASLAWKNRPHVLRTVFRELPVHAILLPLGLLFLAPMAWMFLAAFTPSVYLQTSPPQVSPSNFSPENYGTLLERAPLILRWLWNSTYLSLLITVVQVLLSCLSGYVFARISFPGRGLLFSLFVASIMVPFQALLIPLFIVISTGIRNVLHIDIMNTHWAIFLPTFCAPVGVFLMRQFIIGMPRELDEAAYIDGCGYFGTWARVILPLCKPILGAWGILSFTAAWRNFFWPFVVLGSEELFTLEVGLQSLQQQNAQDFGLVMAGATISAVPMIIIFFIFQKQIVRGLTFGAVKG